MATIIRVQGNRLELAIPLQKVTMTPNGKVTEDYNVPADAEVKVVLSSSWKTYGFEPISISGNVVTIRDDGKLPAGKYAVEVRIRQADGTPLRSKYCNIIDIRDCNDGVTQEYDDFIEGSVTLDAQIFWFAKGDDGITPHIDETTGNWFIGDEDTGVHAQGEAGTTDYNELDNKPDLTIYQEKEAGKGLSTNDYTTEEKTKLAGLENYDDTNVLNLIEQTIQNFANYYTKQQTYSQSEVNQLLETQRQGQYVMVEELPTASVDTMFKIYLVPSSDPQTSNIKDEYITIDNGSEATTRYTWEKIGSTAVDLSGYSTTEEMNAAIQTALADYYTKTEADTLLGGKQDTISDLSTIRSGAQAGATAYQKPTNGIPKTDLAQDVKDSLDKADSALQEDTLYGKVNNNGHEYVDLGLPSGTLWAKCNVGADAETGYGNYYMYGKGARQYNSSDSPYTGNEDPLDLSADTARQVLGGSWKMPTQAQMQELIANTTYQWVTNYKGSGINGGTFTATNGAVLFIPAAGYWYNGSQVNVGNGGNYWGSSPGGGDSAYRLGFSNGVKGVRGSSRLGGYSVRGVILPDTTQLKKDLDKKANDADLATVAKSGSYNDLTDKPTIPIVPTNVSAFNNDAGYLTQHQDISGKANKSEMSVVDGTGANADKTTITLKNGTSATVLKSHQDISNFITKSVNDLVNYYLKSETYTKTEVQTLIGAIKQFTYEVVQTLPTATADTMHKIYLVPSSDPQTQNVKDEYITIDNGTSAETRYTWEQIGSTAIDLSGYVTTTALNTALADYTTTANLTTLLAGKQDVINDLSDIRSGAAAGATAYQKPQGGIPSSDMSSEVQTSLVKADSSLQPSQQTLTEAQKQQARNNIGAAGVDDVPTLPNNVSYFSNDSGDGIVPTDGIRGVDIVASSAISITPDVVTAITGEIGSATTITLVVPNDSLRHVWDMFFTTASDGGATIVVPQGATLHVPSGYSIASGKTYEVRVISIGSHYYLTCQEYN